MHNDDKNRNGWEEHHLESNQTVELSAVTRLTNVTDELCIASFPYSCLI